MNLSMLPWSFPPSLVSLVLSISHTNFLPYRFPVVKKRKEKRWWTRAKHTLWFFKASIKSSEDRTQSVQKNQRKENALYSGRASQILHCELNLQISLCSGSDCRDSGDLFARLLWAPVERLTWHNTTKPISYVCDTSTKSQIKPC